MQANKGEWSELYTLFKIFAEREVAAADKDLNPTDSKYIFLGVFRDDLGKELFYDLSQPDKVMILGDNELIKSVDDDDLSNKIRQIFEIIKEHKGGATFAIPVSSELMDKYLVEKIKAKSVQKTDLEALIKDNIATNQRLGFSIKSQIGSPATLLNASKQTNFIYKVSGFVGDITKVDGLSDGDLGSARERLRYILAHGGEPQFINVSSVTFTENLTLIDTAMPNILSDILLRFYSGYGSRLADLCDTDEIGQEFSLTRKSVVYKVKNLLRAVALGMVPSREWDTYLSTYGGYLIVKEDGELVCYHLYNDDQFKDYLFDNTKLDTPDSKKNDFGRLYEQNGEYYINLNLQIRFIK